MLYHLVKAYFEKADTLSPPNHAIPGSLMSAFESQMMWWLFTGTDACVKSNLEISGVKYCSRPRAVDSNFMTCVIWCRKRKTFMLKLFNYLSVDASSWSWVENSYSVKFATSAESWLFNGNTNLGWSYSFFLIISTNLKWEEADCVTHLNLSCVQQCTPDWPNCRAHITRVWAAACCLQEWRGISWFGV